MTDREELFRKKFVKPKEGRTLIVGSKVYPGREDARKLFKNAIGIDLEPGEGVDQIHDLVSTPLGVSDYDGSMGAINYKLAKKFDHAECCSVLEHCKNPWRLASNLECNLKEGSTIYIHAPTVWRWHPYPSDYWRFTHEGIAALFPHIEWSQMRYSNYEGLLFEIPKIPLSDSSRGFWGKVQIHAFGHLKI